LATNPRAAAERNDIREPLEAALTSGYSANAKSTFAAYSPGASARASVKVNVTAHVRIPERDQPDTSSTGAVPSEVPLVHDADWAPCVERVALPFHEKGNAAAGLATIRIGWPGKERTQAVMFAVWAVTSEAPSADTRKRSGIWLGRRYASGRTCKSKVVVAVRCP